MQIKSVVVGLLQTNCYLLSSNGEVVIIDPGDEAEKIIEAVKEMGEVKYIITTHSHYDHNSALSEVKEEVGGKVLTNLKEGDEIKVGDEKLIVLQTPGHTEDSICLMGDGFFISGDVLFYQGYGRTDLPGGDEKKMRETLERLSREISQGTVIYPGHGPSFER